MLRYGNYNIYYGHDRACGGYFLEVVADNGAIVSAYHTHASAQPARYEHATYIELAYLMQSYGVPKKYCKRVLAKGGVA